MKQALHIFKKDVRYLRWEILLLLACTALFTVTVVTLGRTRFVIPLLLPLAWAVVCARLIQAETIPGDRQFWITRPYEWRSLLGAKLMFVAIFVSIPFLIADAAILVRNGFPLGAYLPGLLCSMTFLTAGVVLTMCALAAVTRGLAQWILAGLAMAGAFAELGAHGTWSNWGGVDWMRDLGYVAILFTTATMVLFWQYHHRRTLASRITLGVGLLAAWLFHRYAPEEAAWALQTRFSTAKVDPSPIRLALHEATERTVPHPERFLWRRSREMVELSIPLDVSGLENGLDVFGDEVRMSVAFPEGEVWRSEEHIESRLEHRPEGFLLLVYMDRDVFVKAAGQRVDVRFALNLTLLGNPVSKIIQAGAGPVAVPGIGLCMIDEREPNANETASRNENAVVCRTALRMAANYLVMNLGEDGRDRVFAAISYSPLPADASLIPIRTFWHGGYGYREGLHLSAPVLISLEPLAHFKRNVDAHGIYLADYQAGPR